MLKGIDPILTADVLYAIRAMGHGDRLALVDTNFPANSVASRCVIEAPAPMDNVSMPRALEAILSLFPLEAAGRMEVMGSPTELPEAQLEAQAVIDRMAPEAGSLEGIERFQFYEDAKAGYVVVPTGERRFYGCILLTKGVISPDD